MTAFTDRHRSTRHLVSVCIAGIAAGISLFATARATASDLPSNRLRVRIPARGIYALTAADLAAAGVPVLDAGFDPRTLRLAFDGWKPVPLQADSIPASWQADYAMSEVAIWVAGEDDGRLDAADGVVFYALGPAGWDDLAGVADSLAHSQHPYDRFDYGWLVWGGGPGLRMETRSASAQEPLADPPVTRTWHREHREEDRLFVPVGDLLAWERIHPATTTRVEFELDLGTDSTATGALRLQFGSVFMATSLLEVRLNDFLLGNAAFIPADGASRSSFESVPLRAHNTLALRLDGPPDSGTRVLLELEATWARSLVADAQGELGWSARPGTNEQIYELAGFGSTPPLLLDVTDHRRPLRLTDLTPVGDPVHWRARHGRGAGRRVHYLATTTPRRMDPETDLELRDVIPLRSRTSSPDMLIVTHPDLVPAVERLAAHRRTHLPGVTNPEVLVTTTRDIYENFSGGRQDPLAIRNWVKFLYGLSTEPRLAYLLLFGDATQDPRQALPGALPTLVPAVQPSYADARARQAYAVEDWFGAMHTPAPNAPAPQSVVSIGRLPARNLAEADRMVDKILAYESDASFGAWRGRVLVAADDECSPLAGCGEVYFTGNAESLCGRIPAALDVDKVYMTEYPRVGARKPAARAALIQAWSEGCALVAYNGRGNGAQLADEVLLLASDVPLLTNGARLPLVLTFHDDGADFDRMTTQTYLEHSLASPAGGAIAAIGATAWAFIGPGYTLAVRQFTELFRAGATTQQPVGLMHRLAKRATRGTEQFVLLGDPALVLRLPRALVTFTSGADSLAGGQRARIAGIVHLPGETTPLNDFDGNVDIEVRGNADESGYRRTEPPPLEIAYVLPGTPIYRGQAEVRAGRFAFEFTVPPLFETDSTGAKSTLLGPGGRVAAYAWNSVLDAKGGRDGVVLTRGTMHDSSLAPPQIRVSFPSGALRVTVGAMLTAVIEDENGICIVGDTPERSILLQLDGDEPIDITAAYRSTGGSDIAGTVSVPLPALPPGPHRATLSASDNLGNIASASLEFEIIEAASLSLTALRASPNPTRGGTDFTFLLDVAADIELRVFGVDGREVFHSRQHHDGLRRGLVRWNGRSTSGRPVTSGVYLYKLEVRPAGSPIQHRTGKLAVLR